MKEIEKKFFYKKFKPDESYFELMEEFHSKKCKVKVIIQKNKDLAEKLRTQIVSYFKD